LLVLTDGVELLDELDEPEDVELDDEVLVEPEVDELPDDVELVDFL
jgi:hypothetical protein